MEQGSRYKPIEPGIWAVRTGGFRADARGKYLGVFPTLGEARFVRAAQLAAVGPDKRLKPEPIALDTEGWLRACVEYNPETGWFTFKIQRGSAKPGSRAGKVTNAGYRVLQFKLHGKRATIAEHRAAFFFMTGRLPAQNVDHLNGVRDDNRWTNLRDVTTRENNRNIGVRETGRRVVRIGGKYYPLIGQGYDCPHEATLFAEAFSEAFDGHA